MNARVTYDPAADAVFISLKAIAPGESNYQCAVDCDAAKGMIVLDLDVEGRLIGIEVIDAEAGLPREVLDAAERL